MLTSRSKWHDPKGTRTGLLLLWLLVLGLLLWIVWVIFHSTLVETVQHESRNHLEASLCQTIAQSAVAELEALVSSQVNDPRFRLFEVFRSPPPPGKSVAVDLASGLKMSDLAQILSSPIYRGYSIRSHSCQLIDHRPIDEASDDSQGLVVTSATCDSPGFFRRISRTVQLTRRFKTVSVSIPRPFAGRTVFFGDSSEALVSSMDKSHHNWLIDRSRELVSTVKTIRQSAPDSIKELWETALSNLYDPEVQSALSPATNSPFGLFQPGAAVDLGALGGSDSQRREIQNIEASLSKLQQNAGRASSKERSVHTGLLAIVSSVKDQLLSALMTSVSSGSLRGAGAIGQLNGGSGLDLRGLDADYWFRRAHYRLRSGPDERQAVQRQFDRLVRLRVNGVIRVDNPVGQPLVLRGMITGKSVVVVGPGGVEIEDLNTSLVDVATLATVHVRSGPVRIRGKNRVSLLVGKPESGEPPVALEIAKEAQILGSLIFRSTPVSARLGGLVIFDTRQNSLFKDPSGRIRTALENRFVGISPRVYQMRVMP